MPIAVGTRAPAALVDRVAAVRKARWRRPILVTRRPIPDALKVRLAASVSEGRVGYAADRVDGAWAALVPGHLAARLTS